MADADVKGNIFNIQYYSVHDGPGIRTIVFFKGCPLKCLWCSNPESQNPAREKAWNSSLCVGCMTCIRNCPQKALELYSDKIIRRHDQCADCDECLDKCPTKAMYAYGQQRNVGEVLDEVEDDSAFYSRSGGGITLSGGEPLFQPEFALAMLREAKARHINRAMESSAFANTGNFLKACSMLNYLLVDVKSIDRQLHIIYTGQDNRLILDNIRKVRQELPNLPVHIRTPVIPGFNDNVEEIEKIATFAKETGAHAYNLLQYHKLGSAKYANLDRTYEMGDKILPDEHFQYLSAFARQIAPSLP